MEYKLAGSIEDGRGIGVKILVCVDRVLTEDEQSEAFSFAQRLKSRIDRNTRLLDPVEQERIKDERENILSLFSSPIYVKEIPGEYCPEDIYPWFLITTPKGIIKIGWRKRVINIDWKESDIPIEAEELTDDEVTKGYRGEKYIHAWGYEKAKEYLDLLLK